MRLSTWAQHTHREQRTLSAAVRRNKNFYNSLLSHRRNGEMPNDPLYHFTIIPQNPLPQPGPRHRAGPNKTLCDICDICDIPPGRVWQWYILRVCPVGSQCGGRPPLRPLRPQGAPHGQALGVPLADIPGHGGVRLAHQARRQGQVGENRGNSEFN